MALFKATKGTANAAPPAPTVVINEIHYNSLGGLKEDEFVELHNKGSKAVQLKGWKLERAVTYEFEDGASIPAGG